MYEGKDSFVPFYLYVLGAAVTFVFEQQYPHYNFTNSRSIKQALNFYVFIDLK